MTMLEIERRVSGWTVSEAAETYDIARWGDGYFSVNASGNIAVHPTRSPDRAIDLKLLVDRLVARGIQTPVLLRFADILKDRLAAVRNAFAQAIGEHNYRGEYCCLYPIKVNQQRQVMEEVLRFGRSQQYGLEAGSKPELLTVIAMAENDVPIVCNGFKDERFIETALLAHKIGRRIFLVVERFAELELILRVAEQVGVRPMIGMRVKLAASGSGRWQSSSGYRSKFGLTVGELLRAVALLKSRSMADCFRLLHFHMGSQITNIRHIKAARTKPAESTWTWSAMGAGLQYLDVGGGLGSTTTGLRRTSNRAPITRSGIRQRRHLPRAERLRRRRRGASTIFSESGRALVAYHSVLVFNVLGTSCRGRNLVPSPLEGEVEQPLQVLSDTYRDLTVRNLLESYHDAQQALDMAMGLFNGGYLPLEQRGEAEDLFWSICRKISRLLQQVEDVPEELENLDALLSETYFCNFSLFQSMPDSWAIKQLFPIMPVHRLDGNRCTMPWWRT